MNKSGTLSIARGQPHADRFEDGAGDAFGFLLADDQVLADSPEELIAVEHFRGRPSVPGARSHETADIGRKEPHQLTSFVSADP